MSRRRPPAKEPWAAIEVTVDKAEKEKVWNRENEPAKRFVSWALHFERLGDQYAERAAAEYDKAIGFLDQFLGEGQATLYTPRLMELNERLKLRRDEINERLHIRRRGNQAAAALGRPVSLSKLGSAGARDSLRPASARSSSVGSRGKGGWAAGSLRGNTKRPENDTWVTPSNATLHRGGPLGDKDGGDGSQGSRRTKSSRRRSRPKSKGKPSRDVSKSTLAKPPLSAREGGVSLGQASQVTEEELFRAGISSQIIGHFADYQDLGVPLDRQEKSASMRANRPKDLFAEGDGSTIRISGRNDADLLSGGVSGPPVLSGVFSQQPSDQESYAPSPVLEDGIRGDELAVYESAIVAILYPVHTQTYPKGFSMDDLLVLLRSAFHVPPAEHDLLVARCREQHGPEASLEDLQHRMSTLERSRSQFRRSKDFETWKARETEQIDRMMKKLKVRDRKGKSKNLSIFSTASATPKDAEVMSGTLASDGKSNISAEEFRANAGHIVVKQQKKTRARLTSIYVDHHHLFAMLMQKLIHFESIESRQEWEKQEEKEVRMSNGVIWLLDEYAVRYGVPELFRKLVLLSILAQMFEHTTFHLRLLRRTLNEVLDLSQSSLLISEQEKSMLQEVIKGLEPQTMNRLVHFTQCFPFNNPPGDLKMLLDITMAINDMKRKAWRERNDPETLAREASSGTRRSSNTFRNLFKPSAYSNEKDVEPPSFPRLLEEAVLDHAQVRYDFFLAEAASPDDNTTARCPFAARQLIGAIDRIMDEIDQLALHFQEGFQEWMDLTATCCRHYFAFVLRDVSVFCDTYAGTSVSVDVFSLWQRVRDLHQYLTGQTDEFPALHVSQMFAPLTYRWIDETSQQLRAWKREAVRVDSWTPVSETHQFSSSIVDVFCMCTEPLQFLDSLQLLQVDEDGMTGDSVETFLQRFTKTITAVVGEYAAEMYTRGMQTFPKAWTSYFTQAFPLQDPKRAAGSNGNGGSSRAPKPPKFKGPGPAVIPDHFVTFINNTEAARFKLDELVSQFERSFDSTDSATTFRTLRRVKNMLISAIVFWLNLTVYPGLQTLVDAKMARASLEQRLDPVLMFLDSQMLVLSQSLTGEVMKKFLRAMWSTIVNDLEQIVCPAAATKGLTIQQAEAVADAVQPLQEFFHAGGDGLDERFILRKSSLLGGLLELYEVDSDNLIELYDDLAGIGGNGGPKGGDVAGSGTDVISSVHIYRLLSYRKLDPKAVAFLKRVGKPS